MLIVDGSFLELLVIPDFYSNVSSPLAHSYNSQTSSKTSSRPNTAGDGAALNPHQNTQEVAKSYKSKTCNIL